MLQNFGSILCLNEFATAIILIAMGCLRKHGKGTAVRLEGWDALAEDFMVKEKVRVSIIKINEKSYYYIQLGYPPSSLLTPTLIYNTHIKNPKLVYPPTVLSSCHIQAFVTTELVRVLRNSSLFDEFLGNYINTALYHKIGYNQRLIERGLETSDSGKKQL